MLRTDTPNSDAESAWVLPSARNCLNLANAFESSLAGRPPCLPQAQIPALLWAFARALALFWLGGSWSSGTSSCASAFSSTFKSMCRILPGSASSSMRIFPWAKAYYTCAAVWVQLATVMITGSAWRSHAGVIGDGCSLPKSP